MWTFGKKIAGGFAISFLLLLGIGTISYRGIESLTRTSYSVAHTHLVLEHVATVLSQMKDAETGQRGYVITGDETYLEPYHSAVGAIDNLLKELREMTVDNLRQQQRLNEVEPLVASKLAELNHVIVMRRSSGFEAAAKIVQTNEGKKVMDDIRRVLAGMDGEERDLLKQRSEEVEIAAGTARWSIVGGTLLCLLFVSAVGFLLTRNLSRQVGSAVRHIQSSSSELQAAANQQTSGTKEQVTSMNEVSTTIKELLLTARQIAESAQRVAHIAEDTAKGAGVGDDTVKKAQEAVVNIKRQVDLIVTHMLDLGKKSQQIGAVLEIINELAEQTNILSINATIEAAGAGEVGKRFAVVADEIRKLADRVGGSTKEIRGLIEEIRAAVNTTVMATESGSKSVDAGLRQFGDVATAFKQIAVLVGTTTEAAREIELSTKQQTTAVEQVNLAVANVAQAAKESEASSSQTLQTVAELTTLSRDLARLIQAQAGA